MNVKKQGKSSDEGEVKVGNQKGDNDDRRCLAQV